MTTIDPIGAVIAKEIVQKPGDDAKLYHLLVITYVVHV